MEEANISSILVSSSIEDPRGTLLNLVDGIVLVKVDIGCLV